MPGGGALSVRPLREARTEKWGKGGSEALRGRTSGVSRGPGHPFHRGQGKWATAPRELPEGLPLRRVPENQRRGRGVLSQAGRMWRARRADRILRRWCILRPNACRGGSGHIADPTVP